MTEKDQIQPTQQVDPFLQRSVEYWLDSSNELGYQPLFCGWLTNMNFKVKYSCKNGSLEQGKDVVAVDGTGMAHAFQLKGGDINLKRWRSEVKPEIEALIEIPINHPEIDKTKAHISYLATNGELDDTVRAEITGLNEGRWKDSPLHVWTRGDLLQGFQSMAKGLLPKDAETYKQIVDLMFSDGTQLTDVADVNNFFETIFRAEESLTKEQRRRDVAAAMLYSNLIAGPYRKTGNHISVIRIMVLFLSRLLELVDRHDLRDEYWIEAYEIVWGDVLFTAHLLESEVNGDGFSEAFTSPFDQDLMPFRKHVAVEYVFALKLAELIRGDETWKTIATIGVGDKYKGALTVWGEASMLPLIFLSLIYKNVKDSDLRAYGLLKTCVLQILGANGRRASASPGLFPPYYDVDFPVKVAYGLYDGALEDSYKCSSYYLKPLIELLVRGNQREIITQNWREISFMQFEQFIPGKDWQYYLWRSPEGENAVILPEKTQSWGALTKNANNIKGDALPKGLRRFPDFIPFFVAVFPHRFDSEISGYLDLVSSKNSGTNEKTTQTV